MGTSRKLHEHTKPVRCIAVEPADPLHGAMLWRLCANCRAMTGNAGTLPLILARITATLVAQRTASARRTAQ